MRLKVRTPRTFFAKIEFQRENTRRIRVTRFVQRVKTATKTCVTNRAITYVLKSFTLLRVRVFLDFHPVGHASEEAIAQTVAIVYIIAIRFGVRSFERKKNYAIITT